jgi:signal transduction histidine kinase
MGNELEFKISTGLKDIIGKDLITDEFIAVFELVKNSYDAFAKNVIITIEDNKLIISDDGKGMSLDDLKNKWLFVAYSAKKDDSEDKKDSDKNESYRDVIQERKHYAGAKGIGRFSSDRLGKLLTIKTKNNDSKKLEELKIDWSKFETNQKNTFETVKVNHNTITDYKVEFPSNSNSGTILEISNLYKVWDRKRILALKHSLEKLINPFSEKNDFNIEIVCSKELNEDENGFYKTGPKENRGKKYFQRDKVNGSIKNAILDILELKTSQITFKISNGEIETQIIDRGELIYHIKEPANEFQIIENLQIDLYYLNRSAKHNFSLKMGIQPIQFGSIFLFKNGFRVQPFGEKGDDSWGIDFRAQQGYNRFLGTRDLFGRVSISSNNTTEFKEVSSRDGGLIETPGYYELINAFDLAHKRLERYVVGVLWGEGFKRRKYFGEDDDKAQEYRDKLSTDKDSENLKIAKSNLGSKLDFIQIIKSLTSNKDIEIIDFNKDFIDLINEKIDDTQIKFITDLKDIADKTKDSKLRNKVTDLEEAFERLKKEKEDAEKKALEEERKKEEALFELKKSNIRAQEEVQRRRKEEEKRRQAEFQTEKKEKERAQAELAKVKAQLKAKEEEEKRLEEEKARIKAEKEALTRKKQLTQYKSAETIEYKDLRDSNHIVGVYSDTISKKILRFKRKLDKGKTIDNKELLEFISGINLANEKIATITRFTTKANYLKASLESTEDIVNFIFNYIEKTYKILYKLKVEYINKEIVFLKTFKPIELTVAIDNILSNSRRKSADKVILEFNLLKDGLEISIRDIGQKLSDEMDSSIIFEEGTTTTRGSGLGLSHIKRIVEDELNGEIYHNPEYTKGFELKIKLKK